eukprot:scaffold55865_cov61-Phaeocystis_antarctica.AAC.6
MATLAPRARLGLESSTLLRRGCRCQHDHAESRQHGSSTSSHRQKRRAQGPKRQLKTWGVTKKRVDEAT